MSKQANITTIIGGKWSAPVKLPNGKRGSLLVVALKNGQQGDRFTATASSGVVTTGTLETLVKSDEKGDRWTVTRDAKSPEQRAADMALRSTATAAFWSSDKGVETAAKRAKRAEADALKASQPAPAASVVAPAQGVPTMVDLLTSLIAAGVAPELAVTQALATIAAMTAATATVKAPAAKITSTTKPAGQPCDACSKVAVLVNHKSASDVLGHAALVCPTCITGDANVIAAKVIRTSSKPAAK